MESIIDLKKLKEEFEKRLQEEELKKKQDEIRFRTISDPFITYDQYSELLKGVNLKPIDRENKAEITRNYKQKVCFSDCDHTPEN